MLQVCSIAKMPKINSSSSCIVCLSDKEELLPLAEFLNLYELLAGKNEITYDDSKLYACVTCYGFFGKIKEFQNKILIAQDVLLSICNEDLQDDSKIELELTDLKDEHSDCDLNTINEECTIYFKNEKEDSKQLTTDNNDNCNDEEMMNDNNVQLLSDPDYAPKKIVKTDIKRKWIKQDLPKTVKGITTYIKKYRLPFTVKYVTEIVNRVKPRVILGEYLLNNHFDQYVDARELRNNTIYVCKLCKHVESDKKQIRKHFFQKKLWQCSMCEKLCLSLDEFNEHFENHHKNFMCDYCDFESKNRLLFEKHMLYHFPQKCKICNKVCKDVYRFRRHIKIHVVDKTYCAECDKYYKNRISYAKHLGHVHTQKKRPKERKPCKLCGLSFVNLTTHMSNVHSPKKLVQCEQCHKFFKEGRRITEHIKVVHNKDMPYVCTICQRAFKVRQILTHHMRTHTGERPHECRLCDAAFAQKVALHSHIQRRHKDAGPEYQVVKKKLVKPSYKLGE